ncbi:MAG: formimidoylglutamase [Bacteroidota bacterium]
MSPTFSPFDPSIWTGRTDAPGDQRWYQVVQAQNAFSPPTTPIQLLGFCSEEGVRRNQGRIGAAAGPDALRKALSGLPWLSPATALVDRGNLTVEGSDLETTQEALAEAISGVQQSQALPIVLGGGHETAWSSYLGLRKAHGAATKLGILNLDAHFDLRKPDPQATSGTPFFQAAQWCQQHGASFHYCCLGVQAMSNPTSLFQTARDLGVQWISAEEVQLLPIHQLLQKVANYLEGLDMVYLTIDLDGFSGAFAPGVSAVNPLGMDPARVLPLLRMIAQSGKLVLLDVCELNPVLDQDQRTAKLGASLIWTVVNHVKQ